jgi:hypothetical protein
MAEPTGIYDRVSSFIVNHILAASITAVISTYLISMIKSWNEYRAKRKMRDAFVDELMTKTLLEERHFLEVIATLKEVIEIKFSSLDKRIEDRFEGIRFILEKK